MSELASLVRDLRARDIRLFLEGGRLRFQAPQGAMDAATRAQIADHRDALVALLGHSDEESERIARVEADSWPLSEQQQRLWMADEVQCDGRLHLAFTIDAPGRLDLARLDLAVQALAAGHEIMRVRFVRSGEAWRQILAPAHGVTLRHATIDAADVAAGAAAAERLAREEREQGFDLTREPPIRIVALDMVAAGAHRLVVTAHHAALDAVAIDLLLADLAALYGGDAPLEAPPIRYVDYAAWQQSGPQQARVAALADEYTALLRDAPEVHRLPLKARRPGGRDARGAQWRDVLSGGAVARLEKVARERGATLFMALEAVFALLIARYGGEPDVVLGAPMANRHRFETERLVGCFAGVMPLRVSVAPQDSFATLLGRVKDFNERVYRLADVPLAMIAERLGRNDASHHPVYQITIGLQPSGRAVVLDGAACIARPHASATSQVDLGLDIMPDADGWIQRWEYRTDLFDEAMVRRMAAHFTTLIDRVIERPDDLLALLPHVDARTPAESPEGRRSEVAPGDLANALLRIADAHPDATALVIDNARLSFAELRRAGERCAAQLKSLGVGRGGIVGLSIERSPDTYATMLGLFLLGAAYVPIDPADPPERHEQVCEVARVAFVIGSDHFAELWSVLWVPAVSFDRWRTAPAATAAPAPPPPAAAGLMPAYVMFSSGSAGRPKAITVSQGAVARLVAAEDWLVFAPGDLGLAGATLAFDASVYEMWVPWLQGAGVVVVDRGTMLDPVALEALLHRHPVRAAFVTTALFNRLSEEAPHLFGRISRVLFGGEHVANRAVANAMAAAPGSSFVHVYGPTENTVFSTGMMVTRAEALANAPVPIGAALATDRAVAVGAEGLPVDVGGEGELLLGGPGLADGYAGDPRSTAARFVPDHLGGPPGSRLYRTGDRVRRTDARNFTFVGRMDRQIKLRGFRIELDEVEEHLRALGPVADAVVTVTSRAGADDALVAHVTLTAGASETGHAVRAALAGRTPAYMRPAAVIVIDAMPLTANGKLDLAALPAVAVEEGEGPAPADDAERAVAAIWREVIGVAVERTDRDFFELGGSSLAAMAVCQAMQQDHGVHVNVAEFLLDPTIAFLAGRLGCAGAGPAMVEIEL